MADGFSNPIVGGGGALVYPSIHSPNYAPGSAGWTINKDGSAEFSGITLRGTFNGTNYIINSAGAFFYSGAPAANNLIYSIVPGAANVQDPYGNWALAGSTSYGPFLTGYIATNVYQGYLLTWWHAAATMGGAGSPWQQQANIWWDATLGFIIQAQFGPVNISGQLLATGGSVGSATLIETDTWHNMVLLNGWGVGAGGFAQYKLMPDNTVMIRLNNLVPGTTADATVIWVPPAGYVPTTQQKLPLIAAYTTAPAYGSLPFLYTNLGTGLEVFNLRGTVSNIHATASYALD